MDIRRWAFGIGPVAAAAGLGGLGARNAAQVYGRLGKPRWAPPAAAFGPVWSALYVSIAAAGWRLARGTSPATRTLHLTQLALNAAWPAAFFAARNRGASLAVIGALDVALTAEVLRLRREDPVTAALLLPYLVWTGYATALNAGVEESSAPTGSHPR